MESLQQTETGDNKSIQYTDNEGDVDYEEAKGGARLDARRAAGRRELSALDGEIARERRTIAEKQDELARVKREQIDRQRGDLREKLERIEREKQRLKRAAEQSLDTLRRASVDSKDRLHAFKRVDERAQFRGDYKESEEQA